MAETSMLPTYIVSDKPPRAFSLSPGALHVEYAPAAGGGNARLWVGLPAEAGAVGNTAIIIAGSSVPPKNTVKITIDPIADPSPQGAVNVTGKLSAGAEIEVAILQGTNEDYLLQLINWVAVDASKGTFDVTLDLPVGNNLRIRARQQDAPQIYADSNIFAITSTPE
jgi:hypothetical protein